MEFSALKVEFKYDHNGMRVEKKVTNKGDNTIETTQYFYHGKKLMRQVKGNHVLHFYYDAEGRPAMVMYNGVMYTYAHSLQGDISAIVDSAGNLVVEYKYDAWGNITHMFGSLAGTLGGMNPFRYRGYVYDVETGLYYLRSRYYNPEWGRFINADTVLGKVGALGTHNLFAYCANNPVMMVDPSGHFAWVVFLAAAVIGLAAGQTAYAPATEEEIPEPSGISVWWEDVVKPWFRDSLDAYLRVFDIHTQQAYIVTCAYDEWLHSEVLPNINEEVLFAGVGGAVTGGLTAYANYSSVTALIIGTTLAPTIINGVILGFFVGVISDLTVNFLREIKK